MMSDGTPVRNANRRCPRCGGLLLYDRVTAMRAKAAEGFDCWRCVNCGLMLDPLILHNAVLSRLRATS